MKNGFWFLLIVVREAELSGEFDAVVGRLILLYFADPLDGLSTIVRRIKKGGIVAFHEMDMNDDFICFSYPVASIWNDTARIVIQTFAGAGMHLRMGRFLMKTFLDAGLSFPSLIEEAVAGGGPDFPGYSWMANQFGAKRVGQFRAKQVGQFGAKYTPHPR